MGEPREGDGGQVGRYEAWSATDMQSTYVADCLGEMADAVLVRIAHVDGMRVVAAGRSGGKSR